MASDGPSGGNLLEFECLIRARARVGDVQMADFERSRPGSAVDLAAHDERASDSATDVGIEQGGCSLAGTQDGLGQSRGIGVIFDNDSREIQPLAQPIREWKAFPSRDLKRFLNCPSQGIDGSAEADTSGGDLITTYPCLFDQPGIGVLDARQDSWRALGGVDPFAVECS